jgi:hypothetical protein
VDKLRLGLLTHRAEISTEQYAEAMERHDRGRTAHPEGYETSSIHALTVFPLSNDFSILIGTDYSFDNLLTDEEGIILASRTHLAAHNLDLSKVKAIFTASNPTHITNNMHRDCSASPIGSS